MSSWEIWGLIVQHMGSIVSVVLVLAILSGRKEARATLGWVLLVAFLPYLGAVAYLLFGRAPLRFLSQERESFVSPPCLSPGSEVCEAMTRTTRLTFRTPVRCSSLELLPDAITKYRRLEEDIEAAQSRVVLCYYVFRWDETGRRFLDLLARKASQGVEVLLLYDGWGAFGLGVAGRLKPYRAKGLKAHPFHPVADPLQMSRINFRNHRKIVVVDGVVAYVGSMNVGDEYTGRWSRPWKDVHVRLEGEAAWHLESVFRGDWRITTGERPEPSVNPLEPGDTWVHVIPSGPKQGEDTLLALLFAQFASARERIDILTPYLVPDPALVQCLRVAARQGITVRVLLPGKSNHPMVMAAGRSYYDELVEAGVELFETREDMLHAKGILVDGAWAMVGSTNLDNRSIHLNMEINVATSHPPFCLALKRLFEQWLGEAVPIDSARLARRPLPQRLLEGACRTLSPVL